MKQLKEIQMNKVTVVGGIKFNEPAKEVINSGFKSDPKKKPYAKKQTSNLEKKPYRKQQRKPTGKMSKFVVQAKVNPGELATLRKLFLNVSRLRSLIEQFITVDSDVDVVRDRALDELGIERNALIVSIANKETYHALKKLKDGGEFDGSPTKSIPFTDKSEVNKLFTINYRRNRIMFEDMNIILKLVASLPKRMEGSSYHMNLCIDELAEPGYVYINYLFHPEPRKPKKKK